MAALKGVNVTKIDAGNSGSNMIDQGLVNSKLEVHTDEYTFTAASIGDTVDIAVLPAGAKVQNVQIYFAALGGSTTLAVGDSSDTARYIAATATSSAGSASLSLTAAKGYVIGTNTGDERVYLTLAGGAATGLVKTTITYTR